MDLRQFQSLGDAVLETYRASGFDERAFPQIAREALEAARLEGEPRLEDIADFLLSTPIKQQPDLAFSNLPPIVYRCERFYIELLFWMDATTAIHQHGFAGAFRVVSGSSLHSVYDFEESGRINSRLLFGSLRLRSAEVLRRGDVRAIRPGRDGLTHALFHLDRPSVTVVVRTFNEPWASPQYALTPFGVAVDDIGLSRDATLKLFNRLLAVAHAADPKQALEILVAKGPNLDFPRLFALTGTAHRHLADDHARAAFIAAARSVHGSLADHLESLLKWKRRTDSLVEARAVVKDPELRFFLGLLLNIPDRPWIDRLIEDTFPGRRAEELCRLWLGRLGRQESAAQLFTEIARRTQLGGSLFPSRMRSAMPFTDGDARNEAFLRVALEAPHGAEFARQFGGDAAADEASDASRALRAYERLRRLPELTPLFIRDAD